MKFFKFVNRKFSLENYKNFVDLNYVIPMTSLNGVRYYEGIDDEDKYYCDFLLSFKGIEGEVLTVLNSKEELETYLNFCYEGDSGVLDLGCIRIDKEYDNCFYGYL